MARARNIKPAFFTNELLVELPFETRLLFIGLWTEADREGRIEDRPKRLKMALFPADNIDIQSMLEALEGLGFIRRYESSGKKVIEVINFKKHQSPHHTERNSVLPPLEVGARIGDNGELTVNSPLDNESTFVEIPLIPDSLIPDSLNPDLTLAAARAEKPAQAKIKIHVDKFFESDVYLKIIRLLRPELEPKVAGLKLSFLVFWREQCPIRDDWLMKWKKWILDEKNNL